MKLSQIEKRIPQTLTYCGTITEPRLPVARDKKQRRPISWEEKRENFIAVVRN